MGRKEKLPDSFKSVAVMTVITIPIFYFHKVISALTTPRTTPTPSLVKTSLFRAQNYGYGTSDFQDFQDCF